MKLLYEEKFGEYRFYNMKPSLLAWDYDVFKGYEIAWSFLDELYSGDRLVFISITMQVVSDAAEIATKYRLLPNDGLIAATCRHYDINSIVTFDEDFKRVSWLKIIPQRG